MLMCGTFPYAAALNRGKIPRIISEGGCSHISHALITNRGHYIYDFHSIKHLSIRQYSNVQLVTYYYTRWNVIAIRKAFLWNIF